MHKLFTSVFCFIIILPACKQDNGNGIQQNSDRQSSETSKIRPLNLKLQQVFPALKLRHPVGLYPDNKKHWYAIEQAGLIKILNTENNDVKVFLDITDRVRSGGERGLLGFALHPDFANNGRIFVSYTNYDDFSIVSEFIVENAIVDLNSEKVIIRVEQPYSNHNGGQIGFGPDGYLYIGFGDGGSAGDPENNGQNTNSLLGALLRVDINAENQPYAIPADNPFVSNGGLDEIYAYGLRNPWRWSFDQKTDELWLADVGQNKWEEINLIIKGGNYGWNHKEANHCYQRNACDSPTFINPVFEYSHQEGQSITGGYVYRGNSIPELNGAYVYGDFVSGKIWALYETADSHFVNQLLIETDLNISTFAQDKLGEIYVLDYQSGNIFSLSR